MEPQRGGQDSIAAHLGQLLLQGAGLGLKRLGAVLGLVEVLLCQPELADGLLRVLLQLEVLVPQLPHLVLEVLHTAQVAVGHRLLVAQLPLALLGRLSLLFQLALRRRQFLCEAERGGNGA